MTAFKVLPDAVRQIVILVVGARFKAAYEIYAHTAMAKARHEISDARLATLAAGERPSDLTEPEFAGYDVATALIDEACFRSRLIDMLLPSLAKEAWPS